MMAARRQRCPFLDRLAAALLLSAVAAFGQTPDREAPEVRAKADPLRWTNPILPQHADPQVTFHSDGYYYLTATVPKYDLIELRRARTWVNSLSPSQR